jgi:hypothetical protein
MNVHDSHTWTQALVFEDLANAAVGRRQPARIALPALWCPFQSSMHRDAARVEEGTIRWMKRWGYIESALEEAQAHASQFGIRAALVHPAGCPEAIQLVSDLTVWLFLTDDSYIEEPGFAGALSVTADHAIQSIRILRNPSDMPPAPSRSLLALQDISERLRVLATPEQVDRFVGGMIEFFLAGCYEAICFSRRALPSLANYAPVRDAINCLRSVCFVFIEIAGGFELPGAVWCDARLQEVVALASRIVSHHHDILSGLRELDHPVPMNLPSVMARELGIPVQEAFARACDMADTHTRTFIDLADRLIEDQPDPTVVHYIDGLKCWIRGNLEWSLSTGRYSVEDHLATAVVT